jgi:hypothetical protein
MNPPVLARRQRIVDRRLPHGYPLDLHSCQSLLPRLAEFDGNANRRGLRDQNSAFTFAAGTETLMEWRGFLGVIFVTSQ